MAVEPDLVTLYAIRYCLSRQSYAFADGLALIEANVDMLHSRGWGGSVASDLSAALTASGGLTHDELDRGHRLLRWLGYSEAARIGVDG